MYSGVFHQRAQAEVNREAVQLKPSYGQLIRAFLGTERQYG